MMANVMTAIVATDVADTIWRISSSRWERRRWLYMPRAPSIASTIAPKMKIQVRGGFG